MKRALKPGIGPDSPRTVADAVYAHMKRDLVNGRFRPGERLRFRTLQSAYGAGVSPLREALSRLAGERFVIGDGQRGFTSPAVSVEAMWDIIAARRLIEIEALKRSIARGDHDWEARIVAACHALTRLPVPPPDPAAREEWDRRHGAFHRALIDACDSPWLLSLFDILYAQTERYRRLRHRAVPKPQLRRNVEGEHRALMDKALARDAEAAARLLEEHLMRTGRQVAASLEAARAAPAAI